jgi:hypothetical protein
VIKKQWPAFLLAFVLPILLVYWWWGGFSQVQLEETEAGPYRYAYLEYEGAISNMRKTQRAVLKRFDAAAVEPGDTINVIMSDPRKANGKVRAHVGYTLGAGAAAPEGLQEGTIPRRAVYQARVQAAVLLAPSKAYQALHDTLQSRGREIAMPTVEVYRPADSVSRIGTFTLEMDR